MKYCLLKKVVEELNSHVFPAKIAKVYQPDPNNIIFKLWNGRGNHRLLLSAEPGQSRIHLTSREFINPSRPPRFCQLLRSRINHIDSIRLQGDDRIVSVECRGEKGSYVLIAELTGTHPNLILVDNENVVVDALNRVAGDGGAREVRAGVVYSAPGINYQVGDSSDPFDVSTDRELPYNFYAEMVSSQVGGGARQDLHQLLIKLVRRQQKKVKKRLARIEDDLITQENAEDYKIRGDLLLSNLHQLKRGMNEVVLLNYYSDPPENISIALDPVLDGLENAQRYFKTYKKYRRGVDHHLRRMEESEEELIWLEELGYQLNDSVNKSDIEDIAEELRRVGLLKDADGLNSRRTTVASGPREVVSPSGLKVVWGRNNRQNDEITTRKAKDGDLWFHAHKIPGSHVVLKAAGGKAQEDDILFAAGIAAGYSKAKTDTRVEVIEANIKHVEKKKGSHPGQVFVRDYKVRLVAPLRVD